MSSRVQMLFGACTTYLTRRSWKSAFGRLQLADEQMPVSRGLQDVFPAGLPTLEPQMPTHEDLEDLFPTRRKLNHSEWIRVPLRAGRLLCRPSLVVCVFHCQFAYFRIVLARKAPQTERISYKILFRKHSEVQCLRALCKRNGSVTHLCPTCCCRDRVFTALDSLYAVWSSLLAVACGGVESVFAYAMCVHPGARAFCF